jgi:hypothetical protein
MGLLANLALGRLSIFMDSPRQFSLEKRIRAFLIHAVLHICADNATQGAKGVRSHVRIAHMYAISSGLPKCHRKSQAFRVLHKDQSKYSKVHFSPKSSSSFSSGLAFNFSSKTAHSWSKRGERSNHTVEYLTSCTSG